MKSKHYILALGLLILAVPSYGQNWKEWFKQKKTQKEYLIQQVIALQSYMEVAKEGYQIVKTGWQTVEDITDGEFSLHRDFFARLDGISPVVSRYHGLSQVLEYQQYILYEVERGRTLFRGISLKPGQRQALETYYREVLRQSLKILTQTENTVKPFFYRMEDAERLRIINQMHKDIRRLYLQVKRHTLKLAFLSRQDDDSQRSSSTIKSLYHETP
ncbi:hypothetical protein KZP23_04770 [Echinicola marina]|uniref:hypothetical protein n=1 Tax=Echinicola marina TaxID=2859768 RepID=UPI001CF69E20|nr:hypothetical protein [Echinicola marina]UCS94346.1 hypothetical protein KZP23_04770 [Echinicola marina]